MLNGKAESLRLGVDVKDRRLRAALVADPEDGISKSSNNSQVIPIIGQLLFTVLYLLAFSHGPITSRREG